MNILKFEKYVLSLIRKNIIPGISILVGQKERILLKRHYGYRSLLPEKKLLERDTIYDNASLTKPLITAFLVVYFLEKKEITLDTPVKKFFPKIPRGITLLHLLVHMSGLPAWYPFFLYKRDYIDQFGSIPLDSNPGNRVNYSCPGYILLFFILKKVSGLDFMELADRIIIKKIGLHNTFLKVPERLKSKTAPTEKGNQVEKKMAKKKHRDAAEQFPWRESIILGETHDANSFYLGGTGGNSGLFSTAPDLFKLSQEIYPETATLLKPESISLFWKNFTPGEKSQRSLGFKLNSSIISSGGRSLSPFAIGHTGFTGTSIWLEPESQNTFILLSNRIHPTVQNINFNRRRRKIHTLLKSDLHLKA